MNIHSIVEDISKDNNNIALVFEKKSLTYKELNKKSNQLARKLNCKDEELVGILLYPSLETIISILAILKSGGAYVPILPSFPNDRINYMINDTKLKKMIVASDYNNSDLEVIDLRTFNYNEFDGSNLNLDIKGTNLCTIIYTSGSTGKPKGILLEHKGVVNVCQELQNKVYKIENKERCNSILFSSYNWDVSISEIFSNLYNGNTIYILNESIKKNIYKLYEYVNINNIEICYFPPALLSLIPYENDCCIKKIIFSGEKCDNKIGQIWRKRVKLYNYIAPGECTIYAMGKQVDSNNVNEIGKPIKNMKCYIVDKNLDLVKKGDKGEWLLSGIGVSRGYLNLPEQTKKSFVKNPFASGLSGQGQPLDDGIVYRSGDYVKEMPNSDYAFIGRMDNQVNIRGKRVELNEVNEAILSCDFIDNSVVKCKTNEENINEYIFCNYTIKKKLISDQNNLEVTYNNKLKDFLKDKLPDYMIPQYFILLDKFQLNASGKIDQNKLKEPALNKDNYKGELLNNDKYILLNKIINKINNTDISYQPDNNLNQIGIDSLKMIQLLSLLNENKYTIEVDLILKCKTINDIISYLNISDNESNNDEKLFQYYRKETFKLHNGAMNMDANDYQIIKYFSSNYYLNNDDTNDLNCINDLSKLKNEYEVKYKLGYNGACQVSTIMNIFELFFQINLISFKNSAKGGNTGQGNILNLVQDINKDKLDKLKLDSNNILNDFSFPSLDDFDIIIFGSESLLAYNKYKHIDTGIEFITREKELIENNVDLSKFEKYDSLTSKELKSCINKLIFKYPSKKFIFIKCQNNDTITHYKKLRKEYNEVYDSFKNKNNIYILDINKCTNYDSRYTSWWSIPVIDIIKITNELNNIINNVIKNDNNNLKISKFFKDNYIYHNNNFKLLYLNENNNYLTSVILMNDKLNDKTKSIGLSWFLNSKYLRLNNPKIKTSKISETKYEKLYSNIPILNCKLIFHARTDKYYKDLRFKIYTGFKWEIIEKEITTEYQKFELDSEFNYSKSSKPRIGFSNVEPNMIIFINNPYFDL